MRQNNHLLNRNNYPDYSTFKLRQPLNDQSYGNRQNYKIQKQSSYNLNNQHNDSKNQFRQHSISSFYDKNPYRNNSSVQSRQNSRQMSYNSKGSNATKNSIKITDFIAREAKNLLQNKDKFKYEDQRSNKYKVDVPSGQNHFRSTSMQYYPNTFKVSRSGIHDRPVTYLKTQNDEIIRHGNGNCLGQIPSFGLQCRSNLSGGDNHDKYTLNSFKIQDPSIQRINLNKNRMKTQIDQRLEKLRASSTSSHHRQRMNCIRVIDNTRKQNMDKINIKIKNILTTLEQQQNHYKQKFQQPTNLRTYTDGFGKNNIKQNNRVYTEGSASDIYTAHSSKISKNHKYSLERGVNIRQNYSRNHNLSYNNYHQNSQYDFQNSQNQTFVNNDESFSNIHDTSTFSNNQMNQPSMKYEKDASSYYYFQQQSAMLKSSQSPLRDSPQKTFKRHSVQRQNQKNKRIQNQRQSLQKVNKIQEIQDKESNYRKKQTNNYKLQYPSSISFKQPFNKMKNSLIEKEQNNEQYLDVIKLSSMKMSNLISKSNYQSKQLTQKEIQDYRQRSDGYKQIKNHQKFILTHSPVNSQENYRTPQLLSRQNTGKWDLRRQKGQTNQFKQFNQTNKFLKTQSFNDSLNPKSIQSRQSYRMNYYNKDSQSGEKIPTNRLSNDGKNDSRRSSLSNKIIGLNNKHLVSLGQQSSHNENNYTKSSFNSYFNNNRYREANSHHLERRQSMDLSKKFGENIYAQKISLNLENTIENNLIGNEKNQKNKRTKQDYYYSYGDSIKQTPRIEEQIMMKAKQKAKNIFGLNEQNKSAKNSLDQNVNTRINNFCSKNKNNQALNKNYSVDTKLKGQKNLLNIYVSPRKSSQIDKKLSEYSKRIQKYQQSISKEELYSSNSKSMSSLTVSPRNQRVFNSKKSDLSQVKSSIVNQKNQSHYKTFENTNNLETQVRQSERNVSKLSQDNISRLIQRLKNQRANKQNEVKNNKETSLATFGYGNKGISVKNINQDTLKTEQNITNIFSQKKQQPSQSFPIKIQQKHIIRDPNFTLLQHLKKQRQQALSRRNNQRSCNAVSVDNAKIKSTTNDKDLRSESQNSRISSVTLIKGKNIDQEIQKIQQKMNSYQRLKKQLNLQSQQNTQRSYKNKEQSSRISRIQNYQCNDLKNKFTISPKNSYIVSNPLNQKKQYSPKNATQLLKMLTEENSYVKIRKSIVKEQKNNEINNYLDSQLSRQNSTENRKSFSNTSRNKDRVQAMNSKYSNSKKASSAIKENILPPTTTTIQSPKYNNGSKKVVLGLAQNFIVNCLKSAQANNSTKNNQQNFDQVPTPKLLKNLKNKNNNQQSKIKKNTQKRGFRSKFINSLHQDNKVIYSAKKQYLTSQQLMNQTTQYILQSTQRCHPQNKQNLNRFLTLIDKQIQLDEKLRNDKKWFNSLTIKDKWNMLMGEYMKCMPKQKEQKHILLSEIVNIFTLNQEENNPFHSTRGSSSSFGSLIESYFVAESFWKELLKELKYSMSLEKLVACGISQKNLDIQRKGYLQIQDLTRFINMQLNKYYRNRDLWLIWQRLSSNVQAQTNNFKSKFQEPSTMNSVENSAIKIPYMSMIKGFGFLNEQLS